MEEMQQKQNSDISPRRRVRLPRPRKQLLATLQRMEKLAQSGTLKETKQADLLIEMGGLQKLLIQIETDEKLDNFRHENESLKAQIEALKSESDSRVDENLKAMMEWPYTSTIKSLESQVEALKSQNVTLQSENAELRTANSKLKTANSELESQVSTLQHENIALQGDLFRIRSRTVEELMAEVRTKLGG